LCGGFGTRRPTRSGDTPCHGRVAALKHHGTTAIANAAYAGLPAMTLPSLPTDRPDVLERIAHDLIDSFDERHEPPL